MFGVNNGREISLAIDMMPWRCVQEDTPVFTGQNQVEVDFPGVPACREGLSLGIFGAEVLKRSRPWTFVLPATPAKRVTDVTYNGISH